MTKKLYRMMDWSRIEGVVYSEEDNPHEFLGIKKVLGGCLVQAFFPDSEKVYAVIKSGRDVKEYPMELADEAGFYAVFISKITGVDKLTYHFRVVDNTGVIREVLDPYSYAPTIPNEVLAKFNAGLCYDVYKYLGAHIREINGIKGVGFAVWAPNAVRVSVVGDFNDWDGRKHQMRRLGDSGVFEIFIPGLKEGTEYKYELKLKGARISIKADPYGFAAQLRPDTASVVYDIDKYTFTDDDWMNNRRETCAKDKPFAVYEVSLYIFNDMITKGFSNYKDIAEELCKYVKDAGYTHVELMPVMEYPLDESLGFQTVGYYAATARFGTPDDLKYLVNYMHNNGIGVILDWNPAHFPMDDHGLQCFDGTCLYEHQDVRQGRTSDGKMCIYNYGRPEVSNYLIANALFWLKEYHADGIKFNDVAQMLYLDYGKSDGEWVANIYGGNENLEALELIKHINSLVEKEDSGIITIADGHGDYPMLTEKLSKRGVGFTYKWNKGFISDLTSFCYLDPLFRAGSYDDLTLSMIYAYSEDYILPMSHEESIEADGTVLNRMNGDEATKRANYRSMIGYMFTHPGKKLIYMDHTIKASDPGSVIFIRELLDLYKKYPALYELDDSPFGFEWINNISRDENILTFLRKSKSGEQLLIVCNFAGIEYEKHLIGVPFSGKYKEVFNTDAISYGGSGLVNKRVKTSKELECDARKNSIRVNIAPLSMCVFTCTEQDAK